MAAIAYITKLAGQADPTNNFPVRAALRGWARDEKQKKKKNHRRSIEFPALKDITARSLHVRVGACFGRAAVSGARKGQPGRGREGRA